jgi:hypothetical protein
MAKLITRRCLVFAKKKEEEVEEAKKRISRFPFGVKVEDH